MKEREVKVRVRKALGRLIVRDSKLLEYTSGERAVVAKLAGYLSALFRGYDVDVEYNRHGLDKKQVNLPPECRGGGRRRVFPDIIVHRRGNDDANLLVIEVKKETNSEPRTCDRAKLEAMKRELGYTCAVLLDLPVGKDAPQREPKEEWL